MKEVQEIVGATRPLAYTTIMTVLERLVKKGKLTRRKAGRAFIYTPTASREAMRDVAVRELLESFFDGKPEDLQAYLHGQATKAAAAVVGGAPVKDDPRLDTALL